MQVAGPRSGDASGGRGAGAAAITDAGARTLRVAATVQGGLHRPPKLARLSPRLHFSWLLANKQPAFLTAPMT